MSHVVGIEFDCSDLLALKLACEGLGCELVEGQRTYKWYGKWMNDYAQADAAYKSLGVDPSTYGKCEHAIRVKGQPDAYEAGVIRNPDGKGYSLIYDFFGECGRKLQDAIGSNAAKLRAHYSLHKIKAEAIAKGKTVELLPEKNGKIRIVVRG